MVIISIDPSINFCGFAVHEGNKLITHALLTSNKSDEDYVVKSRTVFGQIRGVANEITEEKIIILEVPEYWKLAGFAARESGSVFKLTFLCGMIASLDNVKTVTPSGWKGQQSKDVVNNRLRETYKDVEIAKLNHNIVDAIGIGRWYIDKYLKDSK